MGDETEDLKPEAPKSFGQKLIGFVEDRPGFTMCITGSLFINTAFLVAGGIIPFLGIAGISLIGGGLAFMGLRNSDREREEKSTRYNRY